jgi:SSS family transporter
MRDAFNALPIRGLVFVDWAMIAGYLLLSLVIGLIYTRRASRNMKEFFLSGRSMPWWLLGTSLIATTFASDTPLAVTELVRKDGIAGNWLWWAILMTGMTGTIFFSRLWRRASVLTDPELVELRYGGRSAAFLRGFKGFYSSILYNCIVMAWVTTAMATVLKVGLKIGAWEAVWLVAGIGLFYSVLSGFWGVVITDFIQLIIALGGAVVLAVVSVNYVGGMDSLLAQLKGGGHALKLDFFPRAGTSVFPVFLAYIGMLWWCTTNADGGGYIIQRMCAAKNERHSFYMMLWFNIGQYAVRTWPWVVVALVSLIVLPDLAPKDAKQAYPIIMYKLLPSGLLGLMVCSFLAAFMSTINSQLNWGASYLVNDIYKRFMNAKGSERHYVLVSRICTVVIMVLTVLTTVFISTIEGAWKFIASLGSGVGLVLILRWFWWRVNAWSEIAGMATSLIVTFVIAIGKMSMPVPEGADPAPGLQWALYDFGATLAFTVSLAVAVWLVVTLLTRPTDMKRLEEFYLRVRPSGFWGPVRRELALEGRLEAVAGMRGFGWLEVVAWFAGIAFIYGATFGVGKIVLGMYAEGAILLVISAIGGFIVAFAAKKFFSLGRYRESGLSAGAVKPDSGGAEPVAVAGLQEE